MAYSPPPAQPASQANQTDNSAPPANQAQSYAQQAASNRAGFQPSNPPGNSTNGNTDYVNRKNQLSTTKKVAIVGKYGAGTTDSFGNATSTSTTTSTTTYSTVMFNVTPQLSESGTMLTIDIGEIRAAGSLIVYMGSPARTFSLTAKFVSRTTEEASNTFRDVNILKAWRMPMADQDVPETLRLFGYDKSLKGIPCYMHSYNVEWSDDVDYIEASNGTPVPIIQVVTMSLQEVRSMDDLQGFKYTDFKSGTLDQW